MNPQIVTWLEKATSEFFNSSDNSLIENKLKEECINHRLACYIEKNIPEEFRGYYVDIEYNKKGYNEKSLDVDGDKLPIRPDIVIHKRFESVLDNLLAIECKIRYLNKHDKKKLRGLLGDGFSYKESIGISYQKGKAYFLLYLKEFNYEKPLRINKKLPEISRALRSLPE